jgi:hypothetical protein
LRFGSAVTTKKILTGTNAIPASIAVGSKQKADTNNKHLQLQLWHHSLDQVNAYLRQLGIMELEDFSSKMPRI